MYLLYVTLHDLKKNHAHGTSLGIRLHLVNSIQYSEKRNLIDDAENIDELEDYQHMENME